MDSLYPILKGALIIFAVVMCFNIIIFVHELGHFLAGKWRGLQIDRFQIWFGKPIWKKEFRGVQYGLGWIPAGGFVALPQMAPMESIEGGNKSEKSLPPITPLDKIIVAFAGPLFSMLLALAAAGVVWAVGKPQDFVPTQIVGDVLKGEPAEKAGILVGDKITHINGKAVNGFGGSLDSIQESIILSKGKKIEFTVERPGAPEPLKLVSEFKTDESRWFQRSGLRQVGLAPEATKLEVATVGKGSPGEKAGLKVDDELVTVNGQTFKNVSSIIDYIKANGEKPLEFVVMRKGEKLTLTATPRIPIPQDEKTPKHPMLAVAFNAPPYTNEGIVHPSPVSQVTDSLRMMWITITSVISPDSSIGVDHLSGPVGIAKVQYAIWQMDDGWRRILSFMVLFNVNLAVLNMMPFPVLDGGHITLAILEKLRGHPVKSKPLEILQTICALALMSLMLFVTSKDIGDGFGRGGSKNKLVFPQD